MSRRWPIRWRLTLWYATMLAVALGVFAIILYTGLRLRLYDAFDDQLLTQAGLLNASVQPTGESLTLPTSEGADPRSGEHFVRLIDAHGRLVADTSSALDGLDVDQRLVREALTGTVHFTSASLDGETLRIVTTPVEADGRIVGALQVGVFRTETDEAVAQLLGTIVVAMPFVLLIAVAGGYLLAGRALAPVVTITQRAAAIDADDLGARLNLPLPDDELGRLATTFDGMLVRIEEAFERQRRFTGNAAHELRTPLSLMRSQIDFALSRSRSVGAYQEALRALDADLERLTGLVATLLTLSRADTGRLVPEPAPFNVDETIALVLEQYAGHAEADGVQLVRDTAPVRVVGDEDLIVQVLVNLLDNARAHTPAGGTITVGCRREETEAWLWVADTGSGIPPEHHERVFERFYRVDVGRARIHGGAGLGLSISRAIVEAHGGTIALESTVGLGTRVSVRLPGAGQQDEAEL